MALLCSKVVVVVVTTLVVLCLITTTIMEILDRLPIATRTLDLPATTFRDLPISTDPRTFREGLRVGLQTTIKVLVVLITTIKTSTALRRKEDLLFKDPEMGFNRWDRTTTTIMETTTREVATVA